MQHLAKAVKRQRSVIPFDQPTGSAEVGVVPPASSLTPINRLDLPALVRERLLSGLGREIRRKLPSERQLCRELGVSRPTLRRALQQLEQEGVLTRCGGRGERQVTRVRRPRKASPSIVRLLQDGSAACFLGDHLQTTAFLDASLHDAGSRLAVENVRSCFTAHPARALERLVASSPADLWILYRSTQGMQEWFSAQGIPAVVLGSAWAETGLPSVDIDHAAACRHAAGLLIARGHRRLAVFHPDPSPRGDLLGLDALAETVTRQEADHITLETVAHDGTPWGIIARVDQLLRSPTRPDGWLVFGAHFFLTVFTHLLARGIQPGRDISLISRDYDPLLAAVTPAPAHYHRDLARMHRHLAVLIKRLRTGQGVPSMALQVEPVFRDGPTLRPAK
jgi:DNA-binding LacI/PurR family transcriptional regulator